MPIKCKYCDWFAQSDITDRGDKLFSAKRQCIAKLENVASNSDACKYFKPIYFHCDRNTYRLTFDQCIARRRNRADLIGYTNCKKCPQFNSDIKDIIQAYYINMVPVVTPRHLIREVIEKPPEPAKIKIGSGKIKRRGKIQDSQTPTTKRKIKRREKHAPTPQKAKIKRRSKI